MSNGSVCVQIYNILLLLPFIGPCNRSLPNKIAAIGRQNSHFPLWNINVRPKRNIRLWKNLNLLIHLHNEEPNDTQIQYFFVISFVLVGVLWCKQR